MDFGEALKNLKVGKYVRREKWPEDVFLHIANAATPEPEALPLLVLGRKWSFKGDDLLADDWTLVETKGGL